VGDERRGLAHRTLLPPPPRTLDENADVPCGGIIMPSGKRGTETRCLFIAAQSLLKLRKDFLGRSTSSVDRFRARTGEQAPLAAVFFEKDNAADTENGLQNIGGGSGRVGFSA